MIKNIRQNGLYQGSYKNTGAQQNTSSNFQRHKNRVNLSFSCNGGVFADCEIIYGPNKRLNKLVNEALIEVKNANFPLPKMIICNEPLKHQKGQFNREKVKIYLGPNWNWEEKANQDNLSTHNPKHTIYHEIGHNLNFLKDPDYYEEAGKIVFSSEESEFIGKNVSKRAMEGPRELVAEIFAGIMDGKKYNNEIMQLYKKHKGPGKKHLS